MSTVDPIFAQWLESEQLWAISTNDATKARWGAGGVVSERSTVLASRADALTEAARVLGFLGGPIAAEDHLLVGQYADRLGQVVTIAMAPGAGAQLGYGELGVGAGIDVFVIDVEDDRATGLSTLTVLRRL